MIDMLDSVLAILFVPAAIGFILCCCDTLTCSACGSDPTPTGWQIEVLSMNPVACIAGHAGNTYVVPNLTTGGYNYCGGQIATIAPYGLQVLILPSPEVNFFTTSGTAAFSAIVNPCTDTQTVNVYDGNLFCFGLPGTNALIGSIRVTPQF